MRDRDLARMRTTYHAQGVLAVGRRVDFAFTEQRRGAARVTGSSPEPLPSQRVEFFTAGREFLWSHEMLTALPAPLLNYGEREPPDQTYRPGHYEAAWNRAPLGPAFSTAGLLNAREANDDRGRRTALQQQRRRTLHVDAAAAWRQRDDEADRDGVTLGESATLCYARFVVPDTPGRYTLTCTGSRAISTSVLGTRSEGTWTFAAPGVTPTATPLPLLAVRARGAVFGMDDAPAGRLFPLVLHVERPIGAPSARITSLELDVSFDDGATWKSVPVLRVPGSDRGIAILRHPRAPGFVSLRLRAADARGSSVTHTTIRAYALTVVP